MVSRRSTDDSSSAPGEMPDGAEASAGARKAGRARRSQPAATEPIQPQDAGAEGVDSVDCSFLQSLVGYNTRRASLIILAEFARHMAAFDLRQVDFSILSLVKHNPGITSRQLCLQLDILPPNAVAMLAALRKRGLITRQPHAQDGRAMSLFLSSDGESLMARAEQTAVALELQATAGLDADERDQLIRLLQKIYR